MQFAHAEGIRTSMEVQNALGRDNVECNEINDAYERRAHTSQNATKWLVSSIPQTFKHDRSFNLFDTYLFGDHCYNHCQNIEYFIRRTHRDRYCCA